VVLAEPELLETPLAALEIPAPVVIPETRERLQRVYLRHCPVVRLVMVVRLVTVVRLVAAVRLVMEVTAVRTVKVAPADLSSMVLRVMVDQGVEMALLADNVQQPRLLEAEVAGVDVITLADLVVDHREEAMVVKTPVGVYRAMMAVQRGVAAAAGKVL
jgi:hypothetical protein